jgi:hypothetical protein
MNELDPMVAEQIKQAIVQRCAPQVAELIELVRALDAEKRALIAQVKALTAQIKNEQTERLN